MIRRSKRKIKPWEVVSQDGKVLGKHESRKKALAQLRAVEANKAKK